MQIYLARNNQQAGPYTVEQLNEMLANQQVLLTDLAWHQGMPEWKTLGELTDGKLVFVPAYPHSTAQHETISTPSSNQVIQNIQVEKNTRKIIEAASMGKRIAGKLIDLGLLILPQIILVMMFIPSELMQQQHPPFSMEAQMHAAEILKKSMPSWVAFAILGYTFGLLFIQNVLISKSGQSIGKKLFKMQIVDQNTNQLPGALRGFFVRSVLFLVLSQIMGFFPLIAIIFIIDLVMFFSKGNSSLHDRMAKTKVIDISK